MFDLSTPIYDTVGKFTNLMADNKSMSATDYIEFSNKSSAVAEMGYRLTTVDMGRKWGLLCPFRGGGDLGHHLTQCGLGRGLPPHHGVRKNNGGVTQCLLTTYFWLGRVGFPRRRYCRH